MGKGICRIANYSMDIMKLSINEAYSKEECIKRFLAACKHELNHSRRESSVGYQYQRYAWELIDPVTHDLLRIVMDPFYHGQQYKLWVFCKMGQFKFSLAEDEYKKLKEAYFGNFSADKKYHRRVWGRKEVE